MKRGLIVAAGAPVSSALIRALAGKSDIVAAVDGGYRYCRRAGVRPDMLLGDMDSLSGPPPEQGISVERLPCEKDDTDTLFAIRKLIGLGCGAITLCCALGGRLDHTIANLQALAFIQEHGAQGCLIDDTTCAQVLLPGDYQLPPDGYRFFSLFAMDAFCEGLIIANAKYPLDGFFLENSFPIGISNEFSGGAARIAFSSGKLLVLRCRDENSSTNAD